MLSETFDRMEILQEGIIQGFIRWGKLAKKLIGFCNFGFGDGLVGEEKNYQY